MHPRRRQGSCFWKRPGRKRAVGDTPCDLMMRRLFERARANRIGG
jgi:hypothetical protein